MDESPVPRGEAAALPLIQRAESTAGAWAGPPWLAPTPATFPARQFAVEATVLWGRELTVQNEQDK